ncbi:hypothetical protein FXF61_10095 [Pseudomonas sp. C27(2019)]|nr:hypothetical protein FXF61_10095 [Pseudomonas sp. C27(2019)]
MGSSTDKHQFRSTGCSALVYQLKIKKNEHFLRITQRASVVLPLTRLPDVMRALRHPWLRSPQHPHTAIDHRYSFQVCSMALLRQCVVLIGSVSGHF